MDSSNSAARSWSKPRSPSICKRAANCRAIFRAEKDRDLVAVVEEQLLAVIEFKAQVGPSLGNNVNNRAEEAIGNATNLWAADREGAFQPSQSPWLDDVFLLEDCPKLRIPVKTRAPHFPNFPEFLATSSANRYSNLLTKLLRERSYDSASLLLPPRPVGKPVRWSCPKVEFAFEHFAARLGAHAAAFADTRW
jgi:hypothetical protein